MVRTHRPPFKWRGNTYLSAFALNSLVAAITATMAVLAFRVVGRGERLIERVLLTCGVTFVATLSSYLALHWLFGFGGALVDTLSLSEQKRLSPLP